MFGDLNEENAWEELMQKYPAICNHLVKYKVNAKKRYDQGEYWWELRACDYYDEFMKKKIVWPETSMDNQFCFIDPFVYLNKTSCNLYFYLICF